MTQSPCQPGDSPLHQPKFHLRPSVLTKASSTPTGRIPHVSPIVAWSISIICEPLLSRQSCDLPQSISLPYPTPMPNFLRLRRNCLVLSSAAYEVKTWCELSDLCDRKDHRRAAMNTVRHQGAFARYCAGLLFSLTHSLPLQAQRCISSSQSSFGRHRT